jgi:hypothetical protein
MMTVKLSCPLGHKCEETRDDVTYRCAWFTQLRGQNPQSGEEIDERACAMSWMPILMIENAKTTRGTNAAVDSFRNAMERSNQFTAQLLLGKSQ